MVDSQFSSVPCCLDEYIQSMSMEDQKYQWLETLLRECAATDFLSPHRQDQLPFDHLSADTQAAEAIGDDYDSSMQLMDRDDNDLSAYIPYQSTVVPHLPNLHLSQSVMETSSSQECIISSPRSPKCSNRKQTRKFHLSDRVTGKARPPLLFEFLRALLDDKEYAHIIQYVDRKQGVFKLNAPEAIAQLWKNVKGRNSDNKMTYEKLARSLRYYYHREVMVSCPGRFTFRFGPRSGFGTTWWPAY